MSPLVRDTLRRERGAHIELAQGLERLIESKSEQIAGHRAHLARVQAEISELTDAVNEKANVQN